MFLRERNNVQMLRASLSEKSGKLKPFIVDARTSLIVHVQQIAAVIP